MMIQMEIRYGTVSSAEVFYGSRLRSHIYQVWDIHFQDLKEKFEKNEEAGPQEMSCRYCGRMFWRKVKQWLAGGPVQDSLAEWSKAPDLGSGPKGRGFKSHSFFDLKSSRIIDIEASEHWKADIFVVVVFKFST
ncbi:hypothetical protein LINPERPRIM_LOCUS16594 [Linum perenne]